MARTLGVLVLCVAAVWASTAQAGGSVAERRARVNEAAALGEAGVPALRQALEDENALVRRAAVRSLAALGKPAEQALVAALDNDDFVVRRAALIALVGEPSPAAVPYLAKGLADQDITIRETAMRLLIPIEPRTDAVVELLRKAERDAEAPEVQRMATEALRPFQIQAPDTVLLRDRPDMADHVSRITAIFTKRLPREGWRFRTDPGQVGHVEKWQDADFDDSGWDKVAIEQPWTPGYVGVAWYRRTFELPERPSHMAAELHFEGFDESCWVWINGKYVGGQDIGPAGWNRPFRIDVTDALRWNGKNQITVRGMNTTGAGGLYRPVTLEALTLRR